MMMKERCKPLPGGLRDNCTRYPATLSRKHHASTCRPRGSPNQPSSNWSCTASSESPTANATSCNSVFAPGAVPPSTQAIRRSPMSLPRGFQMHGRDAPAVRVVGKLQRDRATHEHAAVCDLVAGDVIDVAGRAAAVVRCAVNLFDLDAFGPRTGTFAADDQVGMRLPGFQQFP